MLFSELGMATQNVIEGENCWILFPWTARDCQNISIFWLNTRLSIGISEHAFSLGDGDQAPDESTSWRSLLTNLQERRLSLKTGVN
jgi:hypothetical protein